MSINIRVNSVRDTGVFYGGDEICGTVEIRGLLDFPRYNDTKVNIVFSGSSAVARVLKGHVYDDQATFFQAEKVLYVGVVDLKSGASQTWQFSFMQRFRGSGVGMAGGQNSSHSRSSPNRAATARLPS